MCTCIVRDNRKPPSAKLHRDFSLQLCVFVCGGLGVVVGYGLGGGWWGVGGYVCVWGDICAGVEWRNGGRGDKGTRGESRERGGYKRVQDLAV